MRIGMMLRSLNEKGGIGVYSQNVVREILKIDHRNEFYFYYRTPEWLGAFQNNHNVVERVTRAPNKALWDQISIPLACWQDRVDVLFNPKFTLPLLAPCKSVMVIHGADWFLPEHAGFYHPVDVCYIKIFMPLYLRKASRVISVSQITTDHYNQIFNLPPGKVETVYFGPASHFMPVNDQRQLNEIRNRYKLPQNYIFTLTKSAGGERKNFGRLIQAYARYHASSPEPHKLVVGGQGCEGFRQEYDIPRDGYGKDVLFPGWLDQADLPAIYSMASVYLYPSNVEAFPIPLTEAMACGTPIITSRANGLEEIAGDAALLVEPTDPEDIAGAIERVLSDDDLRHTLSVKGRARATRFTWDACARNTLDILTQLG